MKLKKTFAKIIFNFIYNQKTVSNFVEFLFCLFRPFLPSPPHFNLIPIRKDRRKNAVHAFIQDLKGGWQEGLAK